MKKRMISLLVLLFVILLISVAFSLHVLAEAVVSNVVFTSEDTIGAFNVCGLSDKADIILAAYDGVELTAVKLIPDVSFEGDTCVEAAFTFPKESKSYKIFCFGSMASLRPLTAEKRGCIPPENPEITAMRVNIGGISYEGDVDPIYNTITVDVTTEINKDGTVAAMPGAPSSEEFDKALTSLAPTFECSDGAYVIGNGESADFTNPVSCTVTNGIVSRSYTVIMRRSIGQRRYNLASPKVETVNPTSVFGSNDPSRYGAPGAGGTVWGGGMWKLEGFQYTMTDGVYNTDSSGNYIPSPDNTGMIVIDVGNSCIFKKTGNGLFSMYSCNGAAPTRLVETTVSNLEMAADEISGGAFSVQFADSMAQLELVPAADGIFALKFGCGDNLADTGLTLERGRKYVYTVIASKYGDSEIKSELYIDGVFAASVVYTQEDTFSLQSEHIKFSASDDTLCTVRLFSFDLRYCTVGIPEDVRQIYDNIGNEVEDIYLWSASLFDNTEIRTDGNGFFYAQSSKDNPDQFSAEIESTGQMVWYLYTIGVLEYMPSAIRESIITFFESRYDSSDGFYYDPMYRDRVNDRGTSRNLSNASGSLKKLYALRDAELLGYSETISKEILLQNSAEGNETVELALSDGDFDYSSLPPQYASPEKYLEWIDSLPWDTNSWAAGDLLSTSPTYIKRLPESVRGGYYKAAVDWLYDRQNDNGTFGPNGFGIEISGIFKVCLFLKGIPVEYLRDETLWMPGYEQVFEYITENFESECENLGSILMIRNTLDVFIFCSDMVNEAKVVAGLPDIIRCSYESMCRFRIRPGEYCSNKYNGRLFSSASTGMGYNQSLGLEEGTINVNSSMEKLYDLFSKFYGLSRPKMTEEYAERLYEIMAGDAFQNVQ